MLPTWAAFVNLNAPVGARNMQSLVRELKLWEFTHGAEGVLVDGTIRQVNCVCRRLIAERVARRGAGCSGSPCIDSHYRPRDECSTSGAAPFGVVASELPEAIGWNALGDSRLA